MRERGYHIALATTLFAILLWGSVKLGGQYQSVRTIPVVLDNIPDGFASSRPLPRFLRLTLRGEGWSLAGELWNTGAPFHLDVQNASATQKVWTIQDMEGELGLHEGVELVSMKPESVFVTLVPAAEKRVPVSVTGDLRFADGYGLSGEPIVAPESVRVIGSATVVHSLSAWEVAVPDQGELRSSLEKRIGIADSLLYYVFVSPDSVTFRLNVQPLAEKSIMGVPVTVYSAPDDREVILIPPKVDLLVRGAIDQLAAITVDDCRVMVDYAAIMNDTVRSVIPTVKLPRGLLVIARTPDRLQFVTRERPSVPGTASQ
ncbi:MAG: hypothetical protein OEV30_02330 [Ignavibacteria bacterium]|nr:hypothetical protein [Ignavibacteria bacterium]